MTKKFSVIHDGDFGSDDFVTLLMILSRPDLFNLVGVTSCHGNVGARQAALNAAKALYLGGRPDIPVASGSEKPLIISPRQGDNMFSHDGLSGVPFADSPAKLSLLPAVEFMKYALEKASEPLTFVVTGPMTNIAMLINSASPTHKSKIEKIVAMGGGYNPDGNITPYAEFNFYMDPDAADCVLNSDIPIILHTLHSDHMMELSPANQNLIRNCVPQPWSEKTITLMRSAEVFDMKAFGSSGSYIHDQQTVLYLQNPDLYEVFPAAARVNTDSSSARHGQLTFREQDSNLKIVRKIKDPVRTFGLLLENLRTFFEGINR